MDDASLSRRAWAAAGAVVLLALAIRVGYLWAIPWNGPDFIVIDPDGYTENGLMLARRHFAMSAMYRAVSVFQFVKPPLYSIALALANRLPTPYPVDAAFFQAILGGAMVFAMFWIGYRIHSVRAGILGALIGTVYWPFATGANIFVQEQLYVPLLTIAFAALVDAAVRRAPPAAWAAAGALFGLATLTRSMPVYYLGPALAIYVWRNDDRRRAMREAGACFVAFILLIAPYSIAISRHVHQLVIVENMGSISFPMRYPDARNAVHHTAPPPTVLETAGMLVRTFAAHPIQFTSERLGDALTLVRLRGGRTVQVLEGLETATEARVYKALIDTFDDGVFALVCVLAPLGWALARQRRETSFLAGWIALNVALLAAFTFTSARYRTPLLPFLMVLSGVVLAGGWRRPSKSAIAAAAIVSVAVASAIAGSVPSVLAGRAEYGVRHSRIEGRTRQILASGDLGLDVMPLAGAVIVSLAAPSDLPPAEAPARIDIRVDGVMLETWTAAPGASHTVRYLWTRSEAAYVELRARGATGQPAPFSVEVPVALPEHAQ